MNLEEALIALNKLPEEQTELKTGLETLIKSLNQEKGKAKSDITKVKLDKESIESELGKYKEKVSTYSDLMKTLSDAGIDAKNADKLAQKLNIDKTKDDELSDYKRLLNEATTELTTLRTEKDANVFQSKLNPTLDKALSEFKDGDGNLVRIAERFLNKEELYKPLDLENETMVNDRIKRVLEAAHAEQKSVLDDISLPRGVHQTQIGDKHFSSPKGIAVEKIIETVREQKGSKESIVQGIAAIRAVAEKSKG